MPRFRRPKSEAKIYLRGILPTLTPADFVSEMIAARAKKNQNGAQWQNHFITKHGNGTASPPPPDKTGKTKIRCICESFRGEN